MNEETEQLALDTAEAIAKDPQARAQDRVAAARLVAQLRGELDARNRPGSGSGIVHVHLCEDCSALKRAADRIGEDIRIGTEADREEPYRWGPGIPD